jgi:hypothetical protein
MAADYVCCAKSNATHNLALTLNIPDFPNPVQHQWFFADGVSNSINNLNMSTISSDSRQKKYAHSLVGESKTHDNMTYLLKYSIRTFARGSITSNMVTLTTPIDSSFNMTNSGVVVIGEWSQTETKQKDVGDSKLTYKEL